MTPRHVLTQCRRVLPVPSLLVLVDGPLKAVGSGAHAHVAWATQRHVVLDHGRAGLGLGADVADLSYVHPIIIMGPVAPVAITSQHRVAPLIVISPTPELEIGLSPAFLRPNKANKAKHSSVSECLHSGVSLVRGGKTRLTRLNSGVGILEQLVGGWVTRLNYCGRHAGKI